MTHTLITQPDDPRIAAYTSIREKDLTRGHVGRFIVEGKITLETLLTRSRFALESLFLCETRLEPLSSLLAQVPDDVPVFVAPQTVMDEIVGFPIHRGVLACGVKGKTVTIEEQIKALGDGPRTILALVGLSNHDNVGACFRNAAAFGADAVLLDAQSCDPLYRKAIRVSSGASLWLPFAHQGSATDILKTLHAYGFETWAMTPDKNASNLTDLTRPERLAIVLGAEGPGLSAETIAQATSPVRINMSSGFDSINVATAGAIALSQIFLP